MAVRAGRVSLLLSGLIFLVNKNPALAGADLFEKNIEIGVDEQKIARQDVIHVETDAAKNFPEDEENEHFALQERGITISGGGRIINGNSFSSIFPGANIMTGGHMDVQIGTPGEPGGIIIQGYSRDDSGSMIMNNNKLYVGEKLVCSNLRDTQKKATYQKSSDGSLWYTNAKVGEPMLPNEIEEFKEEWARYEEERAKRDAEREARLKREEEEREERMKRQQEELDARLKRQEVEREERMKRQQEELDARLKRQEVERETRMKRQQEELDARLKRQEVERETRMKRQQDEQNARMKRQEAEREMQLKQQQNELNRQLKRAQTQRETQWKRQQDELNARLKREEAEREARRKQEEKDREARLKKQEKDFSESETADSETDDSEDDDDFGSGDVHSGNWMGSTGSYMFYGNQFTLSDFNGITITMSSPSKTQAIDIRGARVTVNKKVVCRNSRELLAEPTYQKSKDGAMWYTNLKVGEPMTDEETEQFKAAIEKRRLEKEAEKKRKEEERERRRKEKEEERQRREEERERRRKEKEEERQRREEERERQRREKEEERVRQRREKEEERERKRKEKEERANSRIGRKSSRFYEDDAWW